MTVTTKRKPRAAKAQASAKTYMLRTYNADLTSYGGFQWPDSGPVACPDWSPRAECGNGLHGLLMGAGGARYLDGSECAKWLVVEVDAASVVDIGRKVKVPAGVVVFCGDRSGAVADILARGADPAACVYGTATAGYGGTATAGYGGTMQIRWWDGQTSRYRIATAYPGEGGIKPGVRYRLDDKQQFVESAP